MPARTEPNPTRQPKPAMAPRLRATRPLTAAPGPDDELIMNGVQLRSVDLSAVDSSFAEVTGSRLDDVTLAGSRWRHAAVADSVLTGCDLANAEFVESGWQRCELTRSRLVGIRAAGCVWKHVVISDSMINLANLRFLEAQRVRFSGCQLTGADLGSAQLSDVLFEDCDLTEADFSNARLTRVTLRRCRLAKIGGVAGLAGATVDPEDLLQLADSLAAALGIRIATPADRDG